MYSGFEYVKKGGIEICVSHRVHRGLREKKKRIIEISVVSVARSSAIGGGECGDYLSSAKLRFDMFLEKKSDKVFSFLRVKSCQDKTLCDYIRKSDK